MIRAVLFMAGALVAAPASATLNVVLPGSGLAAPVDQTAQGNGFVSGVLGAHTESFNSAGSPTSCAVQDPGALNATGFDGYNVGLGVGVVSQRHANPAGDTGCYAAVGFTNGHVSGFPLSFNYTPYYGPLTYFGLYWGTIDPYNTIEFLNANFQPILWSDGAVQKNGEQVAEMLGICTVATCPTVLNTYPAPSHYIEFTFAPSDNVATVVLGTGNNAFEFDNLAWLYSSDGVSVPNAARALVVGRPTAVDEPGGAGLLLSFGMTGIGLRRRIIRYA